MNKVCIIGGSRYFGRHLIASLLADGDAITVVNRGSAPAPAGVRHLIADRDDEAGLRAALRDSDFDVVVDQVCYTPVQAAIARRVFAGRTARYVMTSTIEVYHPGTSERLVEGADPVAEDVVDLRAWPVDPDQPWDDASFRDAHYGEGKRQAEAVLTGAPFPVATIRSGHVIGGGSADFTGRLAHYVDRIAAGVPIGIHAVNHPSSFVTDRQIAEVLRWAVRTEVRGPVNAASTLLDVHQLGAAIAAAGGGTPRYAVVAPDQASPYAFDRYYAMDTTRIADLGFTFDDGFGRAIAEGVGA
ncbi:MAG: reductase [Hamadaea sp.]|nr:reductase [Hamadaea sp.]